MDLRQDDNGVLYLTADHTFMRAALLFAATAAVVAASVGEFPLRDWRNWVGFGMMAGGPAVLCLWIRDSEWAFDPAAEVARWDNSRLLWGDAGEVPLDDIRRVVLQERTNYDEDVPGPTAYRVALVVRGRDEIPLTREYYGRDRAELVAAAVREAVGCGTRVVP